MLAISHLYKSFGGRVLFNDTSLTVNLKDRMALVGPNGAGKTTFFEMIAGQAPGAKTPSVAQESKP